MFEVLNNEVPISELVFRDYEKVVLYFTASWCGPCKKISPVVEELGNDVDYKDSVCFIKIDVDEFEQLVDACNINAMPTFIFYKGGKEVDRMEGADENALRTKVAL
jgi:thioredoxin 1